MKWNSFSISKISERNSWFFVQCEPTDSGKPGSLIFEIWYLWSFLAMAISHWFSWWTATKENLWNICLSPETEIETFMNKMALTFLWNRIVISFVNAGQPGQNFVVFSEARNSCDFNNSKVEELQNWVPFYSHKSLWSLKFWKIKW